MTNTGSQTDSIDVRLRTTGGIGSCGFDETQTRNVAAGQTASVTFTQSCALALDVNASYTGTATIDRSPGASDSESDTTNIAISVGGGSNPTPTPPPTPTQPPSGGDPSIDLLPLNMPDVDVNVGESFDWQVRVKNNGTVTESVDIRLRATSGISVCPFDEEVTRTIGPGQTATVTFTQSCLVTLDVLATYTATATVDRAPGASDSESDSCNINVGILGGGGEPTPTPDPTPPPANEPAVDVLSLDFNDVSVTVNESFSLPVRIRNTGNQTDQIAVRLQTLSGIALCPFDETQTRSVDPGETVTVNFNQDCPVALSVLATYRASATIERGAGATDSETTSVLIEVTLFGADDGPMRHRSDLPTDFLQAVASHPTERSARRRSIQ